MQVHAILMGKATAGVVTVPPGTSVAEAAGILSEKRIGTVVVSEDGKRAQGILSERDVVRGLAQRGAGCLSEPVESLMTSKLVTCQRTDTADAVLHQMTEGRFRHMPVVEGGEMLGLITQGDVVKARLGEISMERDALEDMIMGR